jgi:hypothetical protein
VIAAGGLTPYHCVSATVRSPPYPPSHMDQEMTDRLLAAVEAQGKKIDEVAESVHRVRQYMFWTAVATVAFLVLPLVGLAFVIPSVLGTLSAGMAGL